MKKLKGHRGDVFAVLVFQKWILSAGYDRTIRVWNASNGHFVRVMSGHTHIIRSLTAIPPSLCVASASWDHTVRVWNIRTGSLLATLEGHSNRVKQVIYHPSHHSLTHSLTQGYLISCSDDCTLKLWDAETYCELRTYTTHSQAVLCVAVAEKQGHSIFASGSADHTVQLFMLEDECETTQSYMTLTCHQAPVTDLVFSSGSECATLYSCSEDMSILLWDCTTGYVLHHLLGHTAACQSVSLFSYTCTEFLLPTHTDCLVSTSLDGTVRIWSTSKHQEEKKYQFSNGCLYSAAVGDEVVSGNMAMGMGMSGGMSMSGGISGGVSGGVSGSGSPVGVGSGQVLVIAGDDGLLQMYSSFVENYIATRSHSHSSSKSKSRRRSRDNSNSSLPTIGHNTKTLSVRLPMKLLMPESTTIHHVIPTVVGKGSSRRVSSEMSEDNDGQWSSRSATRPLIAGLLGESGQYSGGGGGVYDTGTPQPLQQCTQSPPSATPSTTTVSSNSRLRSRARYHTGPRTRVISSGRGECGSGTVKSKSSRRGKNTLPSLQQNKEFICVTSQYAEPPVAIVDGAGDELLLKCKNVSLKL